MFRLLRFSLALCYRKEKWRYDLAVIGGGFAGVAAALAATRGGARVFAR